MKKNLLKTAFLSLAMLCTGSALAAVGDETTIVDQTFSEGTALQNTDAYTWGAEIQGMITSKSGQNSNKQTITMTGLYIGNNGGANLDNLPFITFTNPIGDETHEVNISYWAGCPQDKGQAATYFDISYFNEEGDLIFTVQEWNGGWGFGASIFCANEDGTTTQYTLDAAHVKKGDGSDVNISVKFSGTNAVVTVDGGTSYTAYTATPNIKSIKFTTSGENDYSRGMMLKNFKVSTTEIESVVPADYTVKFVCGDEEIKEAVVKTGIVGEAISLTAEETSDFIQDGEKYIYVSNDAEGKVVEADGSTVVTITFRKAAKYNWIVKNNINSAEETGVVFEGEGVTVAFTHYILGDDGMLFKKDAINKEFLYRFTPEYDNQVETLEYTNADISNVIYYVEGEDIEGMTASSDGNIYVRASNAKIGYCGEVVEIITLQPGKYKLTASSYVQNSGTYPFVFKVGENEVLSYNNSNTQTSEEFEVLEPTALTIDAVGNHNNGLDYLYIQKTGEAEVNYTIEYVAVPEGAEEGAEAVEIKKLEKTGKYGTVLELTGDLVATISYEDIDYVQDPTVPVKVNGEDLEEGKDITLSEGLVVTITYKSTGVTGIESVSVDAAAEGKWYNLQGIEVAEPTQTGIYIHNGKKVMIKK